MNVTQVGLEVGRARRRAGLSQAELARRASTTQAAISRLENGLKLPGYAVMDRIADALAENITITFGAAAPLASRAERRRRVRAVLGDHVFDPWARDPSPAEARSLEADGLTRERFGVEDLYLDRVHQSTVAPEDVRLPTYLSALAIVASNHDRMDWRYVDQAIRDETEVDPRLMRKIHRRVRRTIAERLLRRDSW